QYKLEEIGGDISIDASSARWGNVDMFGKITELVHGKPTIGNVLVLDFEWSDFLGSFSKFQSKKITEIKSELKKHQGKKIALGPTATLLDPSKSLMKLSTNNDVLAKEKISQSEFAPYVLDREEGIYLSIPTEKIAVLHQYIVTAELPIVSLEAKRSLEDYFLQITSQSN
ncbi:MAG: hypothetical protein EBR55_11440, partial [Chitinophagia bacterium]|nr:hypothetical protein [Chitinophagia bacterium]